jgi:RNA-binding protein
MRAEGQALRPVAEVGKRGLDLSVITEVDEQLRRTQLVKVRIQGGGAGGGGRDVEDEMAARLAEAVGAELIERRGHTVLLFRARGGGV